MGLFSKQAKVKLDEVTAFRASVSSFAQAARDTGNDLINTLTEMEEFSLQRAEALDGIAKSYEQLYSSVKQLESEISRNIASLKTQLSHTPKEIEKQSDSSKGKDKEKENVKKSPNPEYKELQSRIQKENTRLFEAKELAWKVYNEVSHSRRVANELAHDAGQLKSIAPEVKGYSHKIVLTSDRALGALDNSIRAINSYISFQFRI